MIDLFYKLAVKKLNRSANTTPTMPLHIVAKTKKSSPSMDEYGGP
jgi:hypothetical protein